MTKLWHVGKSIRHIRSPVPPTLHPYLDMLINYLRFVLLLLLEQDFSENDFSGILPTNAIAKLLDLQKFHVHQSGKLGPGITGKLPSFKEQKLLHMLDLDSNSMTGSIPSDFLSGVTDVDQLMAIE